MPSNVTTVQICGAGQSCIPPTFSSAGAADTVGTTVAFNANSVCAQVATAGQTGAGFFLASGTLTGTVTPSVSKDNANWTATSFVDISGNTTASQAFTNPNAFFVAGIVLQAGDRYARVCTTAFTSGTASGFLIASTAQPRPPASGADVTDRAGRLLGVVYGSQGQQLKQTATNFNSQVEIAVGASLIDPRSIRALTSSDTVTVVQATGTNLHTVCDSGCGAGATDAAATAAASESATNRSASFSAIRLLDTGQAAGSQLVTAKGDQTTGMWVNVKNASLAVTGTFWQATQPISAASLPLPTGAATDASVTGLEVAQASTTSGQKGILMQGAVTTAAPTYTTAQTDPLSLTTAGALRVDGSGATQPISGTVTANQGAAAALSGGWPVKVTDGTNTQPTGDAIARAIQVDVSDGTTGIAVKAASTAPVATDPALVVTQSPNPAEQCPNKIAINQTTSTQIITGTASKKTHICSIVLVSGGAQNISLVEGTGTVCATSIAAIIGGTTASVALAANGGFVSTSARPWLVNATAANNICLLQSAASNVSGVITYGVF